MRRQRERGETKLEPSRVDGETDGPTMGHLRGPRHGACVPYPSHPYKRHSFAHSRAVQGLLDFHVQPSSLSDFFEFLAIFLHHMPHSTPNISSANPTSLVRFGFSMQSRFVRQQTKLRSSCQSPERRRRRQFCWMRPRHCPHLPLSQPKVPAQPHWSRNILT